MVTKNGSLGYAFAPLPQCVWREYASHALDDDDLRIVLGLYATAWGVNLRLPPMTLTELTKLVGWRKSPNALSKHLRKLKRRGLIDYPRGVGEAHQYRFELLPIEGGGRIQAESRNRRARLNDAALRDGAEEVVAEGVAESRSKVAESPRLNDAVLRTTLAESPRRQTTAAQVGEGDHLLGKTTGEPEGEKRPGRAATKETALVLRPKGLKLLGSPAFFGLRAADLSSLDSESFALDADMSATLRRLSRPELIYLRKRWRELAGLDDR